MRASASLTRLSPEGGGARRTHVGPVAGDEGAEAVAHDGAGVLAGHRQHVLAVHFRLQVGPAQDGVDRLLDELRLPLLDDQDRLLAGAEAHELGVDRAGR